MQSEFLIILPELLLTGGGLLLLMLAAFAGDGAARQLNWVAVAVLVAAMGFIAYFVPDGVAFSGTFSADGMSRFAKMLMFGAAAVALIAAPRFFADYRAEYPILVIFASLGMAIMVSAQDLISLYIGLELNSLSAYVMASFMRSDARSSEAGLKYFVLGSLASGMLLYGASLLYGFTGSLSFDAIAQGVGTEPGMGALFGIVFVLSGLAFKISAVPFHMWTPDVYEGAPTPVTAFFASAPKVAGVILLLRVCTEMLPGAAPAWQQIVTFMAIASMVLGAIGAIGQRNIKRLLAYSSIANVGFILVGIAAAASNPPIGIIATVLYLLVYVVMTLGSFLIVLQLRDADGNPVEDLGAIAGLWRSHPWLAAAFAIFMFSLAGIPPLFGFWPKLLVFNAAVASGLFPLAVIGVIASVIGAFYYLRVIKVMLFDPPADAPLQPVEDSFDAAFILVGALFVSIGGWLLLSQLHGLTIEPVRALLS